MRRYFIYPHRSVRFFPISPWRMGTALGLASGLSAAIFFLGTLLLEAHDRIAWFILEHTRIPTLGERTIDIFPGLGPVSAKEIPFPASRANLLLTGILFAIALVALIFCHRKFPLGRNFVVFLIILLCASGGVVLFVPSFYFDAVVYAQIWLRGEILVWILLPWVSAVFLVVTVPSVVTGFLWGLIIECYVVFWSALRLAFCLGILHYTGILFLPMIWFVLGILFDLVIVLFFYSFALERSVLSAMGGRRL